MPFEKSCEKFRRTYRIRGRCGWYRSRPTKSCRRFVSRGLRGRNHRLARRESPRFRRFFRARPAGSACIHPLHRLCYAEGLKSSVADRAERKSTRTQGSAHARRWSGSAVSPLTKPGPSRRLQRARPVLEGYRMSEQCPRRSGASNPDRSAWRISGLDRSPKAYRSSQEAAGPLRSRRRQLVSRRMRFCRNCDHRQQ